MIDIGRKIGPLPVWAWAAGAGGAFLYIRHRRAIALEAQANLDATPERVDITAGIATGRGPVFDHDRAPDREAETSQASAGGAAYRGGTLAAPITVGAEVTTDGGGDAGRGSGSSEAPTAPFVNPYDTGWATRKLAEPATYSNPYDTGWATRKYG